MPIRIWSTCSRSFSRSFSGVDLVEPGDQRVEVAELADQLGRGLLPHPGNAGDVVRGIALQRLVVDHLVRPEAEPLVDPGDVVHDRVLDAGPRGHQAHPRCDELEHVEVDRDDGRLEVLRVVELLRDRADDVVGLESGHLVDRDAQRLDDLADLRELVAQVVGHLHARALVLGVLLVSERRPGQVERDREVVRLEVLESAQHDAREAEDAVHEVAARRGERRKGEVAAVDEPIAVEQHQAFHRWAPGMRSRADRRRGWTRASGPVYPRPGSGDLRRPRSAAGTQPRRALQRRANRPSPTINSAPATTMRADTPLGSSRTASSVGTGAAWPPASAALAAGPSPLSPPVNTPARRRRMGAVRTS